MYTRYISRVNFFVKLSKTANGHEEQKQKPSKRKIETKKNEPIIKRKCMRMQ